MFKGGVEPIYYMGNIRFWFHMDSRVTLICLKQRSLEHQGNYTGVGGKTAR